MRRGVSGHESVREPGDVLDHQGTGGEVGLTVRRLREHHAGDLRVDLALNQQSHACGPYLLAMAIEEGPCGPVRGPAAADGIMEPRPVVHVEH